MMFTLYALAIFITLSEVEYPRSACLSRVGVGRLACLPAIVGVGEVGRVFSQVLKSMTPLCTFVSTSAN